MARHRPRTGPGGQAAPRTGRRGHRPPGDRRHGRHGPGAAWLLAHTRGRILVLSRNPRLPEESNEWGHHVGPVRADLATTPADEAAAAVTDQTSRPDGVIHAAGLGHAGVLVRRDSTAMREAVAVRERGALVVEHLIAVFRPAVAVYCSSMSVWLGGVDHCDYAAGASLLDGFAHHHRATDTETTVRMGFDWDIWSESGMATRVLNPDTRHQDHLSVGLTGQEGKRSSAMPLPRNCLNSSFPLQTSRPIEPSTLPPNPRTSPHAPDRRVGRTYRRKPPAPEVPKSERTPWPGRSILADSLTLISLIARTKDGYGVEFDLSSFSHRVSVTEILKHMEVALTPPSPPPRRPEARPG
ncbi:ketoreductase domain-containing protein [Streptomyces sp. NPDC018026]|uniref:ketoreductase domain-containing protein n=1 Tax=Streptomyces sp. NPDC018026 TaxID=3365031 RepID=UPI0037918169